jgi:hypothetical protein
MDIEKFIKARPYLYHLTYLENSEYIIRDKFLYSTVEIIRMTKNKDYEGILKEKRTDKKEVIFSGKKIFIRDQRPISEKALKKCLTDDWTCEQFYYHLNDRIFFWCKVDRLQRHFNRYESENPIIFRFKSEEIFDLNKHAKFANINTGATRANSYLGGKAPKRGPGTFLHTKEYDMSIGSVAEVTFEKQCELPDNFEIGKSPVGKWKRI